MKARLIKAFTPAAKPRLFLLGAGFVFLLIFTLILWDKFGRMLAPRDFNLYVMDSRSEGKFEENLLDLFSVYDQRRVGIRVIIKPVVRRVSGSTPQWREILANAARLPHSETLFFELGPPTSTTKKMLRNEIETHFTGEKRRSMLRRVIAFVAVRGDNAQQACTQLEDDWIYSNDVFGDIALIVDDDTLRLAGSCIPKLLTELANRDR